MQQLHIGGDLKDLPLISRRLMLKEQWGAAVVNNSKQHYLLCVRLKQGKSSFISLWIFCDGLVWLDIKAALIKVQLCRNGEGQEKYNIDFLQWWGQTGRSSGDELLDTWIIAPILFGENVLIMFHRKQACYFMSYKNRRAAEKERMFRVTFVLQGPGMILAFDQTATLFPLRVSHLKFSARHICSLFSPQGARCHRVNFPDYLFRSCFELKATTRRCCKGHIQKQHFFRQECNQQTWR